MAGANADDHLVVRIAANISALQADMATAAQSVKTIETAATSASTATSQFVGMMEHLVERAVILEALHEAFNFAKEVIASTARIEELSLATGITTEAIQQLAYVGKAFGVDSEQMARGVEQLSAKLANGDANATSAVQMLGLSVKALMAEGPEEAFLQIAEAVGRVEDPMLKNGLAVELFGGKLAKVLIPMLGDLRTKMEEVPKDALISPENIKAAHDFEVGLEHLEIRLKSWTITAVGAVFSWEHFGVSAKQAAAATDEHTKSLVDNEHAHGPVIAHADALANKLTALRSQAVDPLTIAQREGILELESYGVSHKEIARLVGTSEVAIKLFDAAQKAATESTKIWAAETKQYDDLLAHLAKETFVLAMEHEKQWREERLKAAGLVNAAVLLELDAQIKLNAEWGLNAVGAIAANVTALDRLNRSLDELHTHKVEGISQSAQEQVLIDAYTTSLYDAAVAQDADTAAIAKTTAETYDAVEGFHQLAMASAAAKLDTTGAIGIDKFTHLTAGEQAAVAAGQFIDLSAVNARWEHLSAAAKATIEGRASGGSVATGSPYLVGERGPELFVPQAAGSIVPHAGASGSPTYITIHVNGTAQDVARKVMDEITRTMKASRQFPAA
jgi:hypothetical protein